MTEAVRQALIASLFPADGPEKLFVHVKTYQDISHSSEEMKGTPRYFCLTQKKSVMRLLKVKKNNNGSFHISKTWTLNDIKQLEIANSHSFSITLNKTYLLYVEKVKEKMIFLAFLIDCCKRSANHMPKLVNIDQNRILMYLADPSAPTLGSSSFYNKSTSQSRNSLPLKSSTTLTSDTTLHSPLDHSPLEPVKEIPTAPNSPTTTPFRNTTDQSAPPRPVHRELNPPPQTLNSASSENHLYRQSPLREDSNKYSVEEENDNDGLINSPQRRVQTPITPTVSRNGVPRTVTHSWSAYKPQPTRSSSSSTFNNRQEEDMPRRSLDGGWQRKYSAKDGMTKAQPIRRSIDGWQPERNPHDAHYYQEQQKPSYDNNIQNTSRKSMDNWQRTTSNSRINSPLPQRRTVPDYYSNERDEEEEDKSFQQPRSYQPNNNRNTMKATPPLPESRNTREYSNDRPIMSDMNRSAARITKVNTWEPPSPPSISSSSSKSDNTNELYDEPDSYEQQRRSSITPTNILRRESSPLYVADRISRSDAKTYDQMDPYNPAVRRSIDSGWQSPLSSASARRDSYDMNSPNTRNNNNMRNSNYDPYSPTPIRRSIDGWQTPNKPDFSDPNSRFTSPKSRLSAMSINNTPKTFEKMDATPPIRRSMDGWQSATSKQELPNISSPRSFAQNSNGSTTEPPLRKSIDGWPNRQTPPESKVYNTLGNTTPKIDAIGKNDDNLKNSTKQDNLPRQTPLGERKPFKVEPITPLPALSPPPKTMEKSRISGKQSPPPIPKPRKHLPAAEKRSLPPIPARHVTPNKIVQSDKEEPSVYNRIDTSKRPLRRTTEDERSSKDIQQDTTTVLDTKQHIQKGSKNDIEETDDHLKNILVHIDKSIAELESMESWLALYGTKGAGKVESV